MEGSQNLFDPELLLGKVGGDVELTRELLVAYQEDAPLRLNDLISAVAAGDGSGASRSAHSLKGMSGVIRVQGLVEMAFIMESAGREGDMDKLAKTLDRFMVVLDSVLVQITDYLGQ